MKKWVGSNRRHAGGRCQGGFQVRWEAGSGVLLLNLKQQCAASNPNLVRRSYAKLHFGRRDIENKDIDILVDVERFPNASGSN